MRELQWPLGTIERKINYHHMSIKKLSTPGNAVEARSQRNSAVLEGSELKSCWAFFIYKYILEGLRERHYFGIVEQLM